LSGRSRSWTRPRRRATSHRRYRPNTRRRRRRGRGRGARRPAARQRAPSLPARRARRRQLTSTTPIATHRLAAPFRGALGRRPASAADPPPPPGALTLIPLADARPPARDARAAFLYALLAAAAAAAAVFLAVPRGVVVGSVSVATERMEWNATSASYQLRLLATVRLLNPNYLPGASVEGDLRVLFYSTEAGRVEIPRTRLAARAAPAVRLDLRAAAVICSLFSPLFDVRILNSKHKSETLNPNLTRPRPHPPTHNKQFLDLAIDASDVPPKYIPAVLAQCSIFPQALVFFLRGRLKVRYLWAEHALPPIDTYFVVGCTGDDDDPELSLGAGVELDAPSLGSGAKVWRGARPDFGGLELALGAAGAAGDAEEQPFRGDGGVAAGWLGVGAAVESARAEGAPALPRRLGGGLAGRRGGAVAVAAADVR
jgi:hypothetical protein